MVRLARDSAESPGRRRTPPAGHVAGNLAGKGETDDWALVPETFSVRWCGVHVAGRRGLDRLSTFVRGSIPWDWSCSRRMLVRASSRPPRWIFEARTRCVQSPCGQQLFTLGTIPRYSTSNPRGEANLTILRQSSFPTYGQTVSFIVGTCPYLCICDSGPRCYMVRDGAFHLVSASSELVCSSLSAPIGTDWYWYSFSRGSPVAMAPSPSS